MAIEEQLPSLLQKVLREQMNEAADHLATGGAKDYNSYANIVGKIEGLAFAERELLNLVERFTKDDD
jgi:hypothetical protein